MWLVIQWNTGTFLWSIFKLMGAKACPITSGVGNPYDRMVYAGCVIVGKSSARSPELTRVLFLTLGVVPYRSVMSGFGENN